MSSLPASGSGALLENSFSITLLWESVGGINVSFLASARIQDRVLSIPGSYLVRTCSVANSVRGTFNRICYGAGTDQIVI